MSLRTALAALPDDRSTVYAAREVIASFADHPREPLKADRVARITGVEPSRVVAVLRALADSVVVDCDGDPAVASCTFDPDAVLQLEIERYLRSGGSSNSRMQASIGKFRTRSSGG